MPRAHGPLFAPAKAAFRPSLAFMRRGGDYEVFCRCCGEEMKKSRLFLLFRVCVAALLMPMFLSACSSNSVMGRYHLSDSAVSDSYATGFHDGRHSGLDRADDGSKRLIKDVTRFAKDADYREGWIEGEKEGIRIWKERVASKGIVSDSKPQQNQDKPQPDNKTVDPAQLQEKPATKLKF